MAMKAEKALVKEGYRVTLIPPPRQFSSDCGIAVRFAVSDRDAVVETLQKNGVEQPAFTSYRLQY